MRYSCWAIILISINLLFSACRLEKREPSDVIVSVGDRYLTHQMLDNMIPIGLSANDSTLFADSYIRHWVEDELMYDIAQKNISDVERIEMLVNKYRHELFVYEYQKQLLNEKFDTEVPTEAARNYYRAHLDKFVLKTPIIKGLFLKVPETSPEINELKKWYRNRDNTSI
ncbi:MAG: peptidyl-prolyl cis-trans isomerase, partial [Prevotella sp.]|nr:peptidyl-prolyl cis-trans isomerase [Prevotella sp.]